MNRRPTSELYAILTTSPLFQGIAGQDLVRIEERVRLREVNLHAGQHFISQGEPCQHLAYLLEGELEVETTSEAGDYIITEHTSGRQLIEPEQLYGMERRYARAYRAHSSCRLMLISIDDVRLTLMHVEVWRINYMNQLCLTATRRMQRIQSPHLPGPEALVAHFLLRQMHNERGRKEVLITQATLGRYVGATRLVMRHTLQHMAEMGVLVMERNRIVIPDATKLNEIIDETGNK